MIEKFLILSTGYKVGSIIDFEFESLEYRLAWPKLLCADLENNCVFLLMYKINYLYTSHNKQVGNKQGFNLL